MLPHKICCSTRNSVIHSRTKKSSLYLFHIHRTNLHTKNRKHKIKKKKKSLLLLPTWKASTELLMN